MSQAENSDDIKAGQKQEILNPPITSVSVHLFLSIEHSMYLYKGEVTLRMEWAGLSKCNWYGVLRQ